VTTNPSDVPARIARFDRLERAVHWCNATLFGVVMLTGAALYAGPISTLVGRRELVRTLHVYTGFALPLPLLVGVLLRSGHQLRIDLRALNRWIPDDFRWLRSRGRDTTVRLGKFNPGQKLNATFIGAVIVVMLATGSIMHWFAHFPNDWRTGATFVHDWFAIGLFFVVVGHIWLAVADPVALRGITGGWVTGTWAKRHRPRWYDEVTGARQPPDATTEATPGESTGETLAEVTRGDR
jgi:formate dehydrogenase subunit gamma